MSRQTEFHTDKNCGDNYLISNTYSTQRNKLVSFQNRPQVLRFK